MTNSFNASFDALAVGAFRGAGLADDAMYTPSTGGLAIPCKVFVDRGVVLQGTQSQVITDTTLITAFVADIGAAPKGGARFQIGAERFTVDSINNKDESRYVCVVKPGN